MSPSRCGSCMRHSTPPISEIPNPTPEQARKIADFDADIEALRKQRETLLHQRNALVPAVNLPPEVLATIFEFACSPVIVSEYNSRIMVSQMDYHFWRPSTVKQFHCACTTTPTLISAVCSAWRNIAMETSQLWSNTKITFNNENSVTQAKKLRYWISKSGQRPLNLSLVEDFDVSDEDRGVWSTAVLDVLEDYAHRLQTLELVVPETWHSKFDPDVADCFPLLTCVSLRPGSGGSEGMPEEFDLFAYAPKLREVRLYNCPIETVVLPWAQLECLEVTDFFGGVEECLDVLRLCPRLRSYMADLAGLRSCNFDALTPMTHTTLEVVELMISSMTQIGIPGLFEALTLPMLRSFSIYIQSGDPLTGIPSLLPFLSRSAGKLETLCLAGQMPLEEQLLGWLEVLPQLRKLVLNNSIYKTTPLTQKTLDLMNPSKYEESASRCLVPNLETFYYRGPIEPTPHALVEFLADRWHSPSAVRTSGDDVEIQPSIGLEARTARERPPPRVKVPLVRLRSVAFITNERFKRSNKPGIRFDDADTAVLQRLQQEGMSIVF